ncbi:expressed unknown protein [Seminavis robusta]|uniref:Uncharacterized protein n=1 Tax=Seminavis robusta TaxID=568900 RepID=A0A9N8DG43_9STRA|nr:expressed unknown protein [Seminavis robusta]|eukprot:Sro75_g040990.1 n/a (195) ;mRNA; f:7200-7784
MLTTMIVTPPRMADTFPVERPEMYVQHMKQGQLNYFPMVASTCLDMPVHVQKKQRSSSKKVRFAATVTYHEAASEPNEACWYQREDMDRIKVDSKMCLLAYHKVGRKASRLARDRYCIRGLENYLSKSTNMLGRYSRKETINSVLLAQKLKGCPDPDHLRVISEFKSRDKVKDAYRMAAKDSRIWLEEYQDLQR